MALAIGDTVTPQNDGPLGGSRQLTQGVLTAEPVATTWDVLWETGLQSSSAIPQDQLRKVTDASADEAVAGKVFQMVQLDGSSIGVVAPKEAMFWVRAVVRLENDDQSSIEVVALLEQVSREGKFSGSTLVVTGGVPAGAVAALNSLLKALPAAKWPRF